MPTVTLCPIFTASQQFTANGEPLAYGKLYTYIAGTTTPLTTYSNSSGTSANPNPIILDASGYLEVPLWIIASSAYKLVLTDANDNPIPGHTIDNVAFISGGSGGTSGVVPIPRNQIAYGNGASITSSKLFQLNQNDKVQEFWRPEVNNKNPAFCLGAPDAAVEAGAEFSLQVNVNDNSLNDPNFVKVLKVTSDFNANDYELNIPKAVIGDLLVNGTVSGLISNVLGSNGLTTVYNSGEVTVKPQEPAKVTKQSYSVQSSETYITPANGQYAILATGNVYRVTITGIGTSTASGTASFKLKLGFNQSVSDTTFLTVSTTTATSGTNIPFKVEMIATVRSDGTNGQMAVDGILYNNGTTGLSTSAVVVTNGGIQTVNTTADNFWGVSCVTSSTSQTINIRQVLIERVL